MDVISVVLSTLALFATLAAFELQRRTKELNSIVALHRELDTAQWNLLEAKEEFKSLRLNSFLNTLEMICAVLNAKYTKQDVIEQSVLNNLAVLKTSFICAWEAIDQRNSEPSAFEEIRKFVQMRQDRLDTAVKYLSVK